MPVESFVQVSIAVGKDQKWAHIFNDKKGFMVLNRYREPFSDKKWMYSWIEQFWIVVYAHAVSAREAARMVRALDSQSMRKLSPKHIKNQMGPVIRLWLDFFEYVPHYLAYLNMIGWVIANDPGLSKLDQQESAQYDTKTNSIIEDSISTHNQEVLNHAGEKMIMVLDQNQRKLGRASVIRRCLGYPRK